jgi:predicted transport protein
MPTFRKYKPNSEKELHGIIEGDLESLEEGLNLLKYEFSTGKGTPDFLCVDSGGRLLIIEVKLSEDENVLFQALRYFSLIDKDRYLISTLFSGTRIDPEQEPRIILIAEKFSEDIRRLSTLIKPEIELFEYTVLIDSSGKKGITYHSVTLPVIEEPISKPLGFDDHREYITVDSLKLLFDRMREQIKSISDEIEEYVTQSYVGYKFRGRQFAWIRVYRRSIEIGAHIIDENKALLDYDGKRIESDVDDYSDTLEKIRTSFSNLGGKLRE